MAKDKKGFVLYCDLISTVRLLPKDKQAELFVMILEYVNDLNPETDDIVLKIAFEPIKLSLKRDYKKYEKTKLARQEAGRIGAQAKKEKQEKANASKAKQEKATEATEAVRVRVKDKVTVTVTDRVIEFKKQVLKFNTYPKEMLDDFIKYWGETSPRGKKARWEKQPTFDINLRLQKWNDNQKKWDKENPNKKRTASKDWRDLIEGKN